MWYDEKYNESIQIIKNSKKAMLEKDYRNIAKELNLLSPESLIYVLGLNFSELVRKVRNNVLKNKKTYKRE